MSPAVPEAVEAITADWLACALGRPVESVAASRIGEEQSFSGGGLYRLTLGGGDTLIAKLSPSDPELRAAFAGANRRESGFYAAFGSGMPVPRCAFGAFDEPTGASVLLLEDLAGYRAEAFVDGLGARDAAAVVRALATIHAARWNAPEINGLPGSALIEEFGFAEAWRGYGRAQSALMPDVALPGSFLALGDHVAMHWRAIFGALLDAGPCTVLHCDCHVDNVMFAPDGQAVLLDWQIMGRGRGTYDLAYALISSLSPGLRRRQERDLVALYHATLTRLGVTGYDLETCWREYRLAVVSKLFVTVFATVLLDNATPAKTAWRRADLARLLAFCADHRIGPETFSA